MESDDLPLLEQGMLGWRGLGITFEVVPVVPSVDNQEAASFLDQGTF